MCCFSRPVVSVQQTNIFARSAIGGRQYVVYSMTIRTKENLAMILPLPVKKDAGENAVEFINLKEYPRFFEDLRTGFPVLVPKSSRGFGLTKGLEEAAATPLEVHQVGDFEASFVPSVKDFSRLDERFQLPPGTWDKLPQYGNYGFAVFKLKSSVNPTKIHPMAFTFPRANERKLFFPTVHIHDGKVHAKAHFDHALFAQRRDGESLNFSGWTESHSSAENFMDIKKTQGIVAKGEHCYKREMVGNLTNDDTWLDLLT